MTSRAFGSVAGSILLGLGSVLGVVRVWGWAGLVPMETALSLALAGLGLLLLAGREAGRGRTIGGAIAGSTLLASGILAPAGYLRDRSLGLDEGLLGVVVVGLGFGALGAAILLRALRRAPKLGEALAGVVALVALLEITTSLYRGEPWHTVTQQSASELFTALGLLLAAAGTASVAPAGPGVRLLASPDAAGIVARRLLLPAVVVPIAVGWFRLQAERIGLYRVELGVALMALASVVGFTGLIAWTVAALQRRQRERAEVESSLRRAETRLRVLSEANLIGILTGDVHGGIHDANEAFLRMVGYSREEVRSGRLRTAELTPPEFHAGEDQAMAELVATGLAPPREKEYLRKDGTRVPVLVGVTLVPGSSVDCVAFVLDLTERKKLERTVIQSQKMEVVGRLAGGVAHDFNNLLTPILGYADLGLGSVSPAHPLHDHLQAIRHAAERAALLTRQLLAFSRKQVLSLEIVDLNDLIEDLGRLLRRVIGEDVALVIVKTGDLWTVRVDKVQMEQVLMNLAVNARDAMPRGGTLTLETANVHLDEEYAAERPEVVPGPHVLVAVSDTGVGMSAEVQSHLFEPFYTTKERGKGTGLGLATVHGIVKQSQGHVWVYSEPGRGTTFKIYLPRALGVPAPSAPSSPRARPSHEEEVVLVVEDDTALREFVVRALEHFGYRTLAAASGSEALALARAYPGPIDLLLTDVVMAGMSGLELAAGITGARRDTRVLYMSGYTENAIVHHGVLDEGTVLLSKPFSATDLARKVREVLEG